MEEYISIVDGVLPGWKLASMLCNMDEGGENASGATRRRLLNWILKVQIDKNCKALSLEIVKNDAGASGALLSSCGVKAGSGKAEHISANVTQRTAAEKGENEKMTKFSIKTDPFLSRALPLQHEDLILDKVQHSNLLDQAVATHSAALRVASDSTIEWKAFKTMDSGVRVVQREVEFPGSQPQLKATARVPATPPQILSYLRLRFNARLGLDDKEAAAKKHESVVHDAKSRKLMSVGGTTSVEWNGKVYELSVKTNAMYKTLPFPWPFQVRDVLWITVTGLADTTLSSLSFDWPHPALREREGYVRLRPYQQGYVAIAEESTAGTLLKKATTPTSWCSLSWLQCQDEGGSIPRVLVDSYHDKLLNQPYRVSLERSKGEP